MTDTPIIDDAIHASEPRRSIGLLPSQLADLRRLVRAGSLLVPDQISWRRAQLLVNYQFAAMNLFHRRWQAASTLCPQRCFTTVTDRRDDASLARRDNLGGKRWALAIASARLWARHLRR